MAAQAAPPSGFFVENLARLREAASAGPVVDLACGRGRHTITGARAGIPMVGIDRNPEFLAALQSTAHSSGIAVDAVRADFEAESSLPLRSGSCGAIIVFRYLHRPLAPAICDALVPGGTLLYETFSIDQAALEWGPNNPTFLLRAGELPELFAELEILEQWEGTTTGDRPEAIGRLLARRPTNR